MFGHDHDEEGGGGKTGGLNNLLLKILSAFIIELMGIGFGIMPYFIKKCRTSNKIMGLANSFSGGLFLGLGLFHILPEAVEIFQERTKVPVPYFLAFAAYAIILFIEKIPFNAHSLMHGGHDHDHQGKDLVNDSEIKEKIDELKGNKDPLVRNTISEEQVESKVDVHEEIEEHHHHQKGRTHEEFEKLLTPYLLLFALGFHGIFEGMALGISSSKTGTLFLLIAIAAHKWAAALTLGISFVRAKVSKQQLIIWIIIFSSIGPLGILLGVILSFAGNEIVEAVFLGISTGTFIYISCSEVTIEEFANPQNKYLKFLMFLIGGIFVSGLAFLEMVEH